MLYVLTYLNDTQRSTVGFWTRKTTEKKKWHLKIVLLSECAS